VFVSALYIHVNMLTFCTIWLWPCNTYHIWTRLWTIFRK